MYNEQIDEISNIIRVTSSSIQFADTTIPSENRLPPSFNSSIINVENI